MKFSQQVISNASPYWQQATEHEFVTQMCDGTLCTKAFSEYLIQDYAFVNAFADLLSYTIAYAQTMEQRHHLSTFLSMLTSEENDYFIRSFKALGVSEEEYSNVTLSPALTGFKNMIYDAINTLESDVDNLAYARCIVVLACAESVYCQWGVNHLDKQPEQFYFNEWIVLHNSEYFQSFVAWLQSELDSLTDLPEATKQQLQNEFTNMCKLEAQFFDECFALVQ